MQEKMWAANRGRLVMFDVAGSTGSQLVEPFTVRILGKKNSSDWLVLTNEFAEVFYFRPFMALRKGTNENCNINSVPI